MGKHHTAMGDGKLHREKFITHNMRIIRGGGWVEELDEGTFPQYYK